MNKTLATIAPVFAAALATGALVLAATPISAFAQTGAPAVHVAYGDLNLTNAQGVAQLDHRIRSAIRLVCPMPSNRELERVQSAAECRTETYRAVAHQREQALADARTPAGIVASGR